MRRSVPAIYIIHRGSRIMIIIIYARYTVGLKFVQCKFPFNLSFLSQWVIGHGEESAAGHIWYILLINAPQPLLPPPPPYIYFFLHRDLLNWLTWSQINSRKSHVRAYFFSLLFLFYYVHTRLYNIIIYSNVYVQFFLFSFFFNYPGRQIKVHWTVNEK